MRFLLDESTEYRLAGYLQACGHDVTAIAHDYPSALSDKDVLALAHREERVLITNDRDFGDLAFHDRLPHCGVIFFRLPAATVETKIAQLEIILAKYDEHLHDFLVVTARSVRVRRAEWQKERPK